MKIVAERIIGRQRQARNRAALSILRAGVRWVELCHEPFQVRPAHAAIERTHGCSGQEVAGDAITVQVNSTDVSAERRNAQVGKVQAQLESPGQLHHTGKIHDVCEVLGERAIVLKPIVEIESGGGAGAGRIGPSVARKRPRAEKLTTMREALVGAQQESLIVLAAGLLIDVDRAVRTARVRIVPLRGSTLRNHGAAGAIEVVQVREHPLVDEVPVNEITAYHEIPRQLPLCAYTELLRGRVGKIRWNQSTLLEDLNTLYRRVAGVDQLPLLIGADRGQDGHQVGAGEQRGRSPEIQRCPNRNARNTGQWIENAGPTNTLPSEPGTEE